KMPKMVATDNGALDDIPGRLADLDQEGIDLKGDLVLHDADLASEEVSLFEAIVAPDFEAAAVSILTTKPKWKNNVRLMQVGKLDELSDTRHYRHIDGGMLVQESDTNDDDSTEWKIATDVPPSDSLMRELTFGWHVVRYVKSNAITVSKNLAIRGVGAGQMSRVDSVEIALRKAAEHAHGSVLASDAFFPFRDSIDKAAEAGIAAVIQPGGSKGDDEVIAACNEHGIAMILTGRRHFKH
ncbi:MAG: bifunctional phosphoribosylaminoimidazolecarboxamide formyltransferase/IMP cyclohydrolase, partial [Planctomycetes bacterium]|nr:bifunctional phosphoribosylaminoimidazolecarboxamide formyltransferase/IMP cyclohydrolase [Planctomycetota bacterium]